METNKVSAVILIVPSSQMTDISLLNWTWSCRKDMVYETGLPFMQTSHPHILPFFRRPPGSLVFLIWKIVLRRMVIFMHACMQAISCRNAAHSVENNVPIVPICYTPIRHDRSLPFPRNRIFGRIAASITLSNFRQEKNSAHLDSCEGFWRRRPPIMTFQISVTESTELRQSASRSCGLGARFSMAS